MQSTLADALRRLYGRRRIGEKLGLDVEQALLECLGNPQEAFAAIHVAGTNGKGSVCAFTAAALRGLGYRVGLYTSPHLVRFNERMRIDDAPIDDELLQSLVNDVEEAADRVASQLGQTPSFFECSTAIAFECFRRCDVQVAVVETGMGGRLDATNVLVPAVAAITRIALEHTQYLGSDLETIAGEKGGIIKSGRPFVCGHMPEEARAVLCRMAAEKGALFVDVNDAATVNVLSETLGGLKVKAESSATSYGTFQVPLPGRHQAENLAAAIAVVERFQSILGQDIDEGRIVNGFESVKWPGRCQLVSENPPMIVDGAHNPDAARTLAEWLERVGGGRPVGLIVGMCDDKDALGFLRAMAKATTMCWAVPINNKRSMESELLAETARRAGLMSISASLESALAAAEQWAKENNGIVCVAGSLFLVGETLSIKNAL